MRKKILLIELIVGCWADDDRLQYPDNVWKGQIPKPASDDIEGLKAIQFLDDILERRGPKSLVYVRYVK